MIINNSYDLVLGLKYLVPTANCCVWETTDLEQYHGETKPILLFNMLVDWRSEHGCPSEKEVLNINQQIIDDQIIIYKKQERDNYYKNDLSIISNFNKWLDSNPSGTFSQYLDTIEQLQKNLHSKLS